MIEEKEIKDYEGLYKITSEGNIYSLDRYNIDKHGQKKFYPGKLLKFDTIKRAHTTYHRVTLSKNGVSKRYQVHRLVAETFIPNKDNKSIVNHIDNNGCNNDVSNLEWCTHSENMIHAQKQGRLYNSQSKGGVTLGKVLDKINENIETLKGTTVNSWKVGEYVGYVNIGTRKAYAFNCTCSCGKTAIIDHARLLSKVVTMCNTCSKAAKTILAVENKLKLLVDSTFEDVKFTGKYYFQNTKAPNIRSTKFEVIDLATNSLKLISYHIIITSYYNKIMI